MSSQSVSIISALYEQDLNLVHLHLESLLFQDYDGPIEILACDDGSKSDLLCNIKKVCLNENRDLRYIWQPDGGFRLSRSRNNGLRCSSGNILIFVDGDIVVGRHFVSSHVAVHDSFRRVVACGSRRWLFIDERARAVLAAANDVFTSWAKRRPMFTESEFQRTMVASGSPWAACMGCNFSISRPGTEILFDEGFVGWGFEDWDFVYKLWHQHDYSVRILECDPVMHVCFGSIESYMPQRPVTHDEIVQYLQNLTRFLDKNTVTDPRPVQQGLLQYELDALRDEWRCSRGGQRPERDIPLILEQARAWLARRRTAKC